MEILGVGPMELIVILLLLLIFFGPDRLPEIGARLGKGVRSMRRATRDFSEELQQARDAIEKPASQIAAPIQEIAQPVKEIATPFQDVKASALALSQTAKTVRDPGQAIRDSVMQSVKGAPGVHGPAIAPGAAPAGPPAAGTVDAPAAPAAPDAVSPGDGGQDPEPRGEAAERPAEQPNAAGPKATSAKGTSHDLLG